MTEQKRPLHKIKPHVGPKFKQPTICQNKQKNVLHKKKEKRKEGTNKRRKEIKNERKRERKNAGPYIICSTAFYFLGAVIFSFHVRHTLVTF
jgi:hypothetical protein